MSPAESEAPSARNTRGRNASDPRNLTRIMPAEGSAQRLSRTSRRVTTSVGLHGGFSITPLSIAAETRNARKPEGDGEGPGVRNGRHRQRQFPDLATRGGDASL